MIKMAGKAKTMKEAESKALEVIENGQALKVFEKMIKAQGGQTAFINDYSKLPVASEKTTFKAKSNGFIKVIPCKEMGMHCVSLGGGRRKSSDKVDPAVGIILKKKVGDKVKKGEEILEIVHHKKQKKEVSNILEALQKGIKISKAKVSKYKLVYESKEI